mmetsp:Transcript_63848/g.76747  ORF Transcript_63848/g.76747 Transcript_63848/m.76747 type:complete len:369 (+) Transcript_63848:29-1135(+)
MEGATTEAPSAQRDASDVYDRQIRLWGADAQSKISSAKVLYITITGISSEILKNLVLAGVQPAICDGRPYPSALSSTPSFFLNTTRITDTDATMMSENGTTDTTAISVAKAMQPLVHELNPLLEECVVDERLVEDIPDADFSNYDIVIASRIGKEQACRISKATVTGGGAFFLVDCFGMNGCAVLDLGPQHEFRREIGKDKLSDVTKRSEGEYVSCDDILHRRLMDMKVSRWDKTVPPPIWSRYAAILNFRDEEKEWPSAGCADSFSKKTLTWLSDMEEEQRKANETNGAKEGNNVATYSISKSLLGSAEDLQYLSSIADAEISPICAVLGGVVGNEVIKALSGKGEPANNVLLFDATDGGLRSYTVQ